MVLQADTAALRIPTPAFDVVAVAASLGGLNALSQVLSALPPDFPASIVVVQHLAAQYPSELAAILDRRTALAVTWAAQGQALRPATAYVAPPDHHVLVTPQGALALSRAPKVHHVRPSADRLFASVACRCKDRAIGVVLTGALCDGAAGAQAIKEVGGRVLVQDAVTSVAFGMPSAAIGTQCVDFVLPLRMIAPALVALVMVPGAAALLHVPPPRATGPSPYSERQSSATA